MIAIGSLRFDGTEGLKITEKVTLRTIEVNEGESVSKGQILARYDEDALKASLREARNTLATQEKTVAQGTGTSQSGIHVIRYAEGRS